MKVSKKRVNIMLPTDLLEKIDTISSNRSKLVEKYIKKGIKELERKELEEKLAQGYRECNEYNLAISKEWEVIDLEGVPEY